MLSFLGLRVMTERDWHLTIDDAARERAQRLQFEEEFKALVVAGQQFAEDVEGVTTQNHDQLRAVITTVLSCNVHLAHRAELAEAEAEQLRGQLTKVLRRS